MPDLSGSCGGAVHQIACADDKLTIPKRRKYQKWQPSKKKASKETREKQQRRRKRGVINGIAHEPGRV